MPQASTQIDTRIELRLEELMEELHELVSRLQLPRLEADSWREQALTRCTELTERIGELLQDMGHARDDAEGYVSDHYNRFRDHCVRSWGARRASLHQRLLVVSQRLHVYAEALIETDQGPALIELYQALSSGYEALVEEIVDLRRAGLISTAKARHIKPVNFARNVFHALMGISCVLLYQFVLTREQALVLLGSFISIFGVLEITRRFSNRWNDFLVDKVFGWVVRPHERTKTNGSTWYVLAMAVIVFFFPKPAVLAAVLTLALADPAASLAGKLWGKRKIVAGKTYLGSLVFLSVAFAVCLPFAITVHGLLLAIPLAILVALPTALVELFITKVDDNFTIPIVCASMAWLVF